jgi:hypothetical protein
MNRLLAFWLVGVFPLLHGEPVQIRTSDLPWAIVGAGYYFVIETGVDARCPDGDVVLSVTEGALPRGLEIKGAFLLGTPEEIGTFRFSVRAANDCSSTVKALELVVTGKPILRAFPASLSRSAFCGAPRRTSGSGTRDRASIRDMAELAVLDPGRCGVADPQSASRGHARQRFGIKLGCGLSGDRPEGSCARCLSHFRQVFHLVGRQLARSPHYADSLAVVTQGF